MAVALMSVTSVHQDVFAKDAGMSFNSYSRRRINIHLISLEKLQQTHHMFRL